MDVLPSESTGSGDKPLPVDSSSSGMQGLVLSLVDKAWGEPVRPGAVLYYVATNSVSPVAPHPWAHILLSPGTAVQARTDARRLDSFRKQEMDWLEAHKNQFKKYENCWLAIDGDRLVAYGPKLSEVCAEAKRKGVDRPLTVFVPPEKEGIPIGL